MASDTARVHSLLRIEEIEGAVSARQIGRVQDHLIAIRARHTQIPLTGNRTWRTSVVHKHLASHVSVRIVEIDRGERSL